MESGFYDTVPAVLQNAALEPSRWPTVLDNISRYVGGAGALLINTGERTTIAPCSPDLEEMNQTYFEEEWFRIDSRYRGIPIMLRDGITSDPDFITESEARRDVFYQDFQERYRRRWFAGLGFRVGKDFWCLSIQRATSRGPFQLDDLHQIHALMRPLRDAATIAREVGHIWLEGSTRALDMVGHAAFVCDQGGRVLVCNDTARGLDAVQIGADRHLSFASAAANDALNGLLKAALQPFLIDLSAPSGCRISLPDHDLVLRAVQLNGHARAIFTGAKLLLLVRREPALPAETSKRHDD